LAYYLSEEFGREEKTIRTFARFILDDVYLVRIQTDSFATGLRIFETINARGRNLAAFDMVKSYLFAVVKPSEKPRLGKLWASVRGRLEETIGEGPKGARVAYSASRGEARLGFLWSR
jgi:hypothetical protein